MKKTRYEDLSKYDVYTVLQEKLSLSEMLVLNWVATNLEEGNQEKIEVYGKDYYIINLVAIHKEINEFKQLTAVVDRYTIYLKKLAEKGYISIARGTYMSGKYGYCKLAVRMENKYKKILNKGE